MGVDLKNLFDINLLKTETLSIIYTTLLDNPKKNWIDKNGFNCGPIEQSTGIWANTNNYSLEGWQREFSCFHFYGSSTILDVYNIEHGPCKRIYKSTESPLSNGDIIFYIGTQLDWDGFKNKLKNIFVFVYCVLLDVPELPKIPTTSSKYHTNIVNGCVSSVQYQKMYLRLRNYLHMYLSPTTSVVVVDFTSKTFGELNMTHADQIFSAWCNEAPIIILSAQQFFEPVNNVESALISLIEYQKSLLPKPAQDIFRMLPNIDTSIDFLYKHFENMPRDEINKSCEMLERLGFIEFEPIYSISFGELQILIEVQRNASNRRPTPQELRQLACRSYNELVVSKVVQNYMSSYFEVSLAILNDEEMLIFDTFLKCYPDLSYSDRDLNFYFNLHMFMESGHGFGDKITSIVWKLFEKGSEGLKQNNLFLKSANIPIDDFFKCYDAIRNNLPVECPIKQFVYNFATLTYFVSDVISNDGRLMSLYALKTRNNVGFFGDFLNVLKDSENYLYELIERGEHYPLAVDEARIISLHEPLIKVPGEYLTLLNISRSPSSYNKSKVKKVAITLLPKKLNTKRRPSPYLRV